MTVSVTMRMRGIGQRGEQRAGIFRRDQQRQDRADDAQLLAVAAAHRQRVEPVLRRQRVARVGAAQRGADDAPAGLAGRQAVIDIGGLMGAVEGADAEMDDARRDMRAVIGRDARPRPAMPCERVVAKLCSSSLHHLRRHVVGDARGVTSASAAQRPDDAQQSHHTTSQFLYVDIISIRSYRWHALGGADLAMTA